MHTPLQRRCRTALLHQLHSSHQCIVDHVWARICTERADLLTTLEQLVASRRCVLSFVRGSSVFLLVSQCTGRNGSATCSEEGEFKGTAPSLPNTRATAGCEVPVSCPRGHTKFNSHYKPILHWKIISKLYSDLQAWVQSSLLYTYYGNFPGRPFWHTISANLCYAALRSVG